MADMFATAADLASRLDVADVDTATAELALQAATGAIQHIAGSRLLPGTNEVVRLSGNRQTIRLPCSPVTAVTSVVGSDGITTTTYTAADYLVVNDSLFCLAAVWPDIVTVTYSHGPATVPAELKALCLDVAARRYTNPSLALSERTADYVVTYATPPVGLLSEAEIRLVRSYRAAGAMVNVG